MRHERTCACIARDVLSGKYRNRPRWRRCVYARFDGLEGDQRMTNRDVINALTFGGNRGGGSAPEWDTFTTTGTLAAPFTFEDCLSLDMADKIYATMAIDATAIGAGNATVNLDKINTSDPSGVALHFSACNIPTITVSDAMAADAAILVDLNNDSVRLRGAVMMQQGAIVDVSQYASLMPTTTTIVYHFPSSND